jgi:hypothetical protein
MGCLKDLLHGWLLNRLPDIARAGAKFFAFAIVGGFFSQIAVPSATPYLEMWAFSHLGISYKDPLFRILAPEGEFRQVKDGNEVLDGLLTYHRVFCGWQRNGESRIDYCVQRIIEPEFRRPPSQWSFSKDSEVKIMLVGREGGHLNLRDPLIFRQCIHLCDVAVLLNRGSYVEQYD